MTTATESSTEIESDVLEALDFEPTPPSCDYTDCETVAAAKLLCGVCYQGCEFMCGDHTIVTAIARLQQPQEPVVFDKTCKHSPELGNCEILAL